MKSKRNLPRLQLKLKELKVQAEVTKLKVGMISGWTLTAIELWSDKKFIKKRIEEQFVYGVCLTSEQLSDRCTRSQERFEELLNASQVVLKRLHDRLQELNSDVSPHADNVLKE